MARRRREAAGQLLLFAVLDSAPVDPAPLPAIVTLLPVAPLPIVAPPPVAPPSAVAPPIAPPSAVAPPIAPPPPLKRGRGRPRREESPLAPPTPRVKAEANSLRSRIILALANHVEISPVLSGIAHALGADPAVLGRVVARLEHLDELETWQDGSDIRLMLSIATARRLGLHLATNGRRWVRDRAAVVDCRPISL